MRRDGGLRHAWSRLTSRQLVVATGLAAALPAIASTVRSIREGWVPIGDDAVIATRAVDVFTTHTPLLGQFSASSEVTDTSVRSLGPLLYWVLAVPARFGGPHSMPVLMGLVNTAVIVGIVWLAHRRGGRPLMFATALAIAIMCSSVPAEIFSDVWNPSAGLLPFTMVIFLAWSLACGDYRVLPLTALVASFALQAHLTYLLPIVAMLVVGVVGLVRSPVLTGRERIRPWAVGAAVVGAVCWSAPLLEQAIHRPGNLVLLARTAVADRETLGFNAGWRGLTHAVGIPPWWLRHWGGPIERFADVGTTPGAGTIASAAVVLVALALFTWVTVRRRRRDLAAAGIIGLVLCVTLPWVATATPIEGTLFYSIGYTLWWGSPAGMWVWGTLALGLVVLLRPSWATDVARWSAAPARLAAALAVLALVALVVAANGDTDGEEATYDQTAVVTAALEEQVPDGASVRVDTTIAEGASSFLRYYVQAAVVYDLRRRGMSVAVPALARPLGSQYSADRGPYDAVLDVAQGPPPPGRLVGRVLPGGTDDSPGGVISVTLTSARGG